MYVGRDFQPSDVGESETYTFDFVRDLGPDEAIIAATWTCRLAADNVGTDDNAADHVALPATFDGTRTSQHVSGLVAGAKYVLQAVVETDQGNTISLWSHVECVAPQ